MIIHSVTQRLQATGFNLHLSALFPSCAVSFSSVFSRVLWCQTGVTSASLPTIKSFIKIVQALKPRALAALHDITHLPGRPDGHIDLRDGKLKFSRVTVKALLREQFAALSDTEQEAYVYRLAT